MPNIHSSLPSENAAIVGVVDPDALTATDHDTAWADVSKFETLMGIALVGDLGASATVDVSIRQATSAAGAGAKAITGKAATQLTKAGSDDNKQVVINVRGSELDLANDFRYVSMRITVGAATSDGGGVLLGFNPSSAPASDNDLSTVDEIKP